MGYIDIDYTNGNKTLKYSKLIRQKFILLINTLPGEMLLDANFGTDVRKYIFKPLLSVKNSLGPHLKEKIETYIPEVSLQNIIFEKTSENNLTITFDYIIIKVNETVTQTIEVN